MHSWFSLLVQKLTDGAPALHPQVKFQEKSAFNRITPLGTAVAISGVEVISMNNYIASEKLAYSVEELSELSTLSAPKIRKDIRNGKLASKKKGSRRIILRDEAMRYLNADETVILNEPDFSFS